LQNHETLKQLAVESFMITITPARCRNSYRFNST